MSEKQWFGHPRGLATCFMTEMWERASYYGMRALLTLYMVGSVLQPGLGFSVQKAAQVYALYTMLVYLSGIPGGWLADRVIGHRRAVLYGGIIIASGHFCMAFPALPFFYLGLGLIIIGTGLLKPNVSTIVGTLYTRDDPRRDAGFSLFYMGINTGAFFAPLVTGWLGQQINWHIGFAAAGVGMVFGIIQYVMGQKYLTPVEERPTPQTVAIESTQEVIADKQPFTAVEWGRISAASILTLFALIFWAGFEQAGSSLTLFADRATNLVWKTVTVTSCAAATSTKFAGACIVLAGQKTYPSSWFQSVEPLFVIILSPIFAWLWFAMKRREPSSPAKFTLGLFFLALSFLLIVPAAKYHEAQHHLVSPMWLVGLYFLQAVGEVCLSPVGLSMVTKLSPARIVGVMMGVWFFATAMGNYVAGWVAGLVGTRSFSEVFMIAFVTAAVVTLVLTVMIPIIKRLMAGVH